MPINFLDEKCSSKSSIQEFGLCDDPPPSSNPAYINELSPSTWIAKVNNLKEVIVTFYAIDNCVDMRRPDGNYESRCDGVLHYSNKLIFVELKSRQSGQWLKKGRTQLTTTINNFKINHNIDQYSNVEAYVCNNLKPLAHIGQATNIQKFKDDTGFILKGKRVIKIS